MGSKLQDTLQTTITSYDNKVAQFRCIWIIYDYVNYVKNHVKPKDCIKSSKTFSPFGNSVSYQLELTPKGVISEVVSKTSSFCLKTSGYKNRKNTWAFYKVTLMNEFCTKYGNTQMTPLLVFVDKYGPDIITFFPYENIPSEFLPNGCLQILVEGTLWFNTSTLPSFNADVKEGLQRLCSIALPVSHLTEEVQQIPFDAKVKLNGREIEVCKDILSSKSNVFKEKFASNNCVEISDISYEAFQVVLQFLYTNTVVPVNITVLKEVDKFAEEYQLDYLRQIVYFKLRNYLLG